MTHQYPSSSIVNRPDLTVTGWQKLDPWLKLEGAGLRSIWAVSKWELVREATTEEEACVGNVLYKGTSE